MIKCSACSFDNLNGTRFCQRCGAGLKRRRGLSATGGGIIASLANPSMGLATFVGIQVDRNAAAHSSQRSKRAPVRVVPFRDGSWYCPDCGNLNSSYTQFCAECGRDF